MKRTTKRKSTTAAKRHRTRGRKENNKTNENMGLSESLELPIVNKGW